jgi:hypothetical protein
MRKTNDEFARYDAFVVSARLRGTHQAEVIILAALTSLISDMPVVDGAQWVGHARASVQA